MPSGLERLRQVVASGGRSPIGELMGFRLVDVGEGFAVFAGAPSRQTFNADGATHDGYAASMLGSASECAAHAALAPGLGYRLLELKVSPHRLLSDKTGHVRALGRVVAQVAGSAGDLVFTEAQLVDGAGQIYATASARYAVTPRV